MIGKGTDLGCYITSHVPGRELQSYGSNLDLYYVKYGRLTIDAYSSIGKAGLAMLMQSACGT